MSVLILILFSTLFSALVYAAHDKDNDGVPDDVDKVIGDERHVKLRGLENIKIKVGHYNSTDPEVSNINGTYNVTFNASDTVITLFIQNFSASQLDLTEVEIIKQDAPGQQGIAIKGLVLPPYSNKTIYLDKTLEKGSVCVKDAEINEVSDISNDCMGDDELFFGRCDIGETIGVVSCIVEGKHYKISGLRHSGAKELNISGIYSGYFTVEYLSTMDYHRDGYLMPGEGARICFESARPITDDEHLRFVFVPQFGGLTINEMWMPAAISSMNVHIYP
ncbi:MAG: hypothetical protein QXK37_02835 [Candidatus Woesearchaeota archaeon]